MDSNTKIMILELVNEKHKLSRGSCGTYIADLVNVLNVSVAEIMEPLSELNKENIISIRLGINGDLVMKNTNKWNNQ